MVPTSAVAIIVIIIISELPILTFTIVRLTTILICSAFQYCYISTRFFFSITSKINLS